MSLKILFPQKGCDIACVGDLERSYCTGHGWSYAVLPELGEMSCQYKEVVPLHPTLSSLQQLWHKDLQVPTFQVASELG